MRLKESINRILVLADKEWIQIRRDSRSLILAIFVPSILILLFGYALKMDVKFVKTGIYNGDKTTFSRQYIERFSHTDYISIVKHIEQYRDIDTLLDSGEIALAIVIPNNFQKDYRKGKTVEIQALVDGSDSTTATVAMGYVKMITYQFNKDLNREKMNKIGLTGLDEPIDIRTRIWYNPELESKNFIIPGLIVLILTIISALLTSLTISREWERGTMESLITTPVRKYEVIFGKLIPYIFIGIFDVVLATIVGYFVFDVPLKGSFIEFCAISILFLIGTSSLGIMISSATRVQVLSIQVAMVVTYLPSFILSGFIFPIENMPVVVQAITYVIPARYLISIINAIALKGVGISLIWGQILFLSIFTIVVISVSIKKFSVMIPEN